MRGKPRICDVLGVAVGQRFSIPEYSRSRSMYVNEEGLICMDDNGRPLLPFMTICNAINDPYNVKYVDRKMIFMECEKDAEKEQGGDSVRHPAHYCEGRKYEPWKVISDWGLNFNLGSVVKYISRAGRKRNALEDLEKAKQYLEFEIEKIRGEEQ